MAFSDSSIIGRKQTICGIEEVKLKEKLWTDEETKMFIKIYKQCKCKEAYSQAGFKVSPNINIFLFKSKFELA